MIGAIVVAGLFLAALVALAMKGAFDAGYQRGRREERAHVEQCIRTGTPFNMIPPPEPWPNPAR